MREEELLKLESATRAVGIPLLIARSYGLMGYLRVRHAALHPCFSTPSTCTSLPTQTHLLAAPVS